MRFYIFLIIFGLGVRCVRCFWPPAYKVDLSDKKVFVITSEEGDYEEEENADEMIRAADLAEFESLAEDYEKFKRLHSHVERYNKRAAITATEFANVFPNSFEPNLEDIHNLVEEAKPFIAGFKHELDEYDFDDLEERVFKAIKRNKRNATKSFSLSDLDRKWVTLPREKEKLVQVREVINPTTEEMEKTILTTSKERYSVTEDSGTRETHEKVDGEHEESKEMKKNEESTEKISNDDKISDAEDYDYQQFKAEYYELIEDSRTDNKTFNYTDNGEPEETAEDAMRKIIDFKMPKNCTREELTQFGAKALECLAYDYKHAKNEKNVKKILSRTWLVVRIWICIYLCIAVPCWCQKGWCCCCFNCAFCKPKEIIVRSKKYYAENPPGILTEYENENGESKTTEFEPTLFELEAYEKFESAIRNL